MGSWLVLLLCLMCEFNFAARLIDARRSILFSDVAFSRDDLVVEMYRSANRVPAPDSLPLSQHTAPPSSSTNLSQIAMIDHQHLL